MITLVLLAVWVPVSVLLGVIIGASIRVADEHAPHAETPEHEAAA